MPEARLTWDEVFKSLDAVYQDLQHKRFSWKCTPAMGAEEFRSMARQMFNAADDNRDGVL